MKSRQRLTTNEDGFVLIVAMMIMVVLSFIGIFATSTSMIELQIAGNDRLAKNAFYRSDGGVQAGIEMIEQNLNCANGFSTAVTAIGGLDIMDVKFAYDEEMKDVAGATASVLLDDIPSDTIRAIRIPNDPNNRVDTAPHTNLAAWGVTRLLPGNAIQMVAGYEGKGKGVASGGSIIEYDLLSQHVGINNSEAQIQTTYRHTVGQEGTCKY